MRALSLTACRVFAMWCCVCAPVSAEAIDLVSGNDYAPYAGSKLKEGGLATALVKAAFKQVDGEVTVAWLPWAQGYAEVKKGRFSATFPYVKTEARATEMLYSDPLLTVQERLYVKAGVSKFDAGTSEAYAGSTLCLASGAVPHPKLAGLLESGKLKRVAPMNVSTCIGLVDSGVADFFVLEERLGQAALKASGLQESAVVLAATAPLSESALYLIAPKSRESSAALIAKLNEGLQKMRLDGSYDQVLKAFSP